MVSAFRSALNISVLSSHRLLPESAPGDALVVVLAANGPYLDPGSGSPWEDKPGVLAFGGPA